MQLIVGPDPHQFAVATVTVSARTVRMTARGDIDLATAPLLLAALLEAIQKYKPQLLELDLAELTFLDAQGVTALLQTYLAARAIDCRVRLLSPPGHIRRVLDITGVPTVWELVE